MGHAAGRLCQEILEKEEKKEDSNSHLEVPASAEASQVGDKVDMDRVSEQKAQESIEVTR